LSISLWVFRVRLVLQRFSGDRFIILRRPGRLSSNRMSIGSGAHGTGDLLL